MAACSDHRDTLVLDVHGELASEERIAWEGHLKECADCRQERERHCALIQRAKEARAVPPLSPEEEKVLCTSIQRTLRIQKPDARTARARWWLAPAFASCMVLLVAGWFSLRGPDTAAITSGRAPEEKTIRTKKELLENSVQDMVAIITERVPQEVISTDKELREDLGTDTAASISERTPDEIIRANTELLENMDLLQDMESLEQLVNLLDKHNHETSLRERGNNADWFHAHV